MPISSGKSLASEASKSPVPIVQSVKIVNIFPFSSLHIQNVDLINLWFSPLQGLLSSKQRFGMRFTQCCGSGFIKSGSSISCESGFKIEEKNIAEKNVGLHKGRPSFWRSLQPSKENIQHFKRLNLLNFFYFSKWFLPSWIRIRDCESESESRDPI